MASASPPPGAAHWAKHTSPDGRPYWSHPQKGSVWEKPDDLKTPLELEMGKSNWKEYETGGRKYYTHTVSKETTWSMPKELKDIVARFSATTAPTGPRSGFPSPGLPSGPSAGGSQHSPMSHPLPAAPVAMSGPPLTPMSGALAAPGSFGLPARPVAGALPPAPAPSLSAATVVSFNTIAEAETAFKGMLRELGVNSSWTWEQVMKEAITEPMYKALKSLAERKAAFEQYLEEVKKEEADERDKSLQRCRKDWHKAMEKLGGGVAMEEGVKSWWSWESGRRVLSEKLPEIWAGPRNDEERKILFDEFIVKLRNTEETRKREMRGRNMDKLTAILQSLQLDLAGPVRWQEARAMFYRTPEWHRDPELQGIEPIDMLTVYEDEVRRAEKELAEQRQRVAEEKRRKARRARDEFNALLHELVASGKMAAGTTWKSVYPIFAHDERYLAVLGAQGSSPLELFWDLVDELDVRAEENQHVVELVAKEKSLVVAEATTEEEFMKALEGDERLERVEYGAIKAAFDRLHARAARAAKDDRRRAEKKLRMLIDDLRYAYKKLDPPVDLDATYEDILPRIQDTPEFAALQDNEEACRTAFEKFVKRQKEKRAEREAAEAEKAERDRLRAEREERRRREYGDDYEREFDRDRGERASSHDHEERHHHHHHHRERRHSPAAHEERKRRPSGAGLDYGETEEGPERKVRKVDEGRGEQKRSAGEDGDVAMKGYNTAPLQEAATAQAMPSTSSTDTASSSSTSPNLSASPLATLSSMTGALPSSGESDAHSRENSYDSSADVLAGEDEQRRHSMDDSDDALRKYKEGLFLYTTARFDRFKTDLERKQRSAGTNGLSRRSSSG
ncbi:hypothetical protein JCM11641_000709 [Rhodosporidiobolus odoratus]